jgi:hypothetical protein
MLAVERRIGSATALNALLLMGVVALLEFLVWARVLQVHVPPPNSL